MKIEFDALIRELNGYPRRINRVHAGDAVTRWLAGHFGAPAGPVDWKPVPGVSATIFGVPLVPLDSEPATLLLEWADGRVDRYEFDPTDLK